VGDLTQRLTKDHSQAQLQAAAAQAILADPHASAASKAQAKTLLARANTDLKTAPSHYTTWTDGGPGKVLLHTLTGALVSHLGGGDPMLGALGAGAAELTRPLTAHAPTWAQHLTSFGLGTLTGGPTGAATALFGEQYNRQLHPDELRKINSHAEAFAQQAYGCEDTCSADDITRAQQRLIIAAARSVDEHWDRTFREQAIGKDRAAETFLNTLVPITHGTYTDFSASWEERHDRHLFADILHKTPEQDQFYGAVLNLAKTDAHQLSLLRALNNTDSKWLDARVDRLANGQLREIGGLWLDFVPVIGDYRAFKDAQTAVDYTLAGVGSIPVVKSAAKVATKAAKKARPSTSTALRSTDEVADNAAKAKNGTTTALKSADEYVDILSPRDKQHILYGDSPKLGGHLWEVVTRTGSDKTPFPPNWSPEKIVHEVGDIVTSPNTKWYAQTGNGGKYTNDKKPARWVAYEVRSDERIKVVYEPANGRVVTAHPDKRPMPKYEPVR